MSAPDETRWLYWKESSIPRVEFAFWRGARPPALAMHFHDEAQITLMLSGCRAFDVGGAIFHVACQRALFVPAGMPHRSALDGRGDAACLNIYLAATPSDPDRPLLFDAADGVFSAQAGDVPALLQAIDRMLPGPVHMAAARRATTPRSSTHGLSFEDSRPIGQVARDQALSREGFSRRFRRVVGMPPHAYRLAGRLNEARRRLREDVPVAHIAADLGFSDQSHFGRLFRRAFGVSPARYRNGERPSQTFQTSGLPGV
jgi:AraC-like DNA-binding protein/mannose-6-phosphate isomerase-like protein (cupin superfamily)